VQALSGLVYLVTKHLHHVFRVLSVDTTKSTACSIGMSKIDYCNSLMYGCWKLLSTSRSTSRICCWQTWWCSEQVAL